MRIAFDSDVNAETADEDIVVAGGEVTTSIYADRQYCESLSHFQERRFRQRYSRCPLRR